MVPLSCPYGRIEGIIRDGIGINDDNIAVNTACLVKDRYGN